jgi:phosphate transport system permease protein
MSNNQQRNQYLKTRCADHMATALFYAAGIVLCALFIAFLGYIVFMGRASLNLRFLTTPPRFMEKGGGIAPQLFNSLYLLFLSLIISVPIGVGAGIYMAEYAQPNAITKSIRLCLETLSSLPSIIVGLFGLLCFVNLWGWGFSLIAGAMALMVINLPVITRIAEESIHNVATAIKEGSLALGATHWQTIWRVILPSALPGLLSGIILITGRVFGEAAALLFTAGMSSPPLNFSDWNPFHSASPLNPFRPAETLAVYTWKINSESLVPDARQIADGSAAVLIIAVLIFNLLARYFGRRIQRRLTGQ